MKNWKVNILGFDKEKKLFFDEMYISFDESINYMARQPQECVIYEDKTDYLMLPTFADLHNHIPQWQFTGIGDGVLLDWLNNYTFPAEKLFEDGEHAKKVIEDFIKKNLSVGITASMSFVTIHKKAAEIALKLAENFNFELFAGMVLMNQNAPEYLLQDTDKALSDAEELAKKYGNKFVITPRFAITCTNELMEKSAAIAREYGLYIQTHINENKGEIEFTKELFNKEYIDIYYDAGVLTSKTVLAHCIHMTERDYKLMRKTDSKAVHCPVSNRFLTSGFAKVKKLLDEGIEVFLGNDVAGGPFLPMQQVIADASMISNFEGQVDLKEFFAMATYKAFEFLNINAGIFAEKKDATFQLIRMDRYTVQLEVLEKLGRLTPDNILKLVIFNNLTFLSDEVYIKGMKVI